MLKAYPGKEEQRHLMFSSHFSCKKWGVCMYMWLFKIQVSMEVEQFFKLKLDKHTSDENFALKKKEHKQLGSGYCNVP